MQIETREVVAGGFWCGAGLGDVALFDTMTIPIVSLFFFFATRNRKVLLLNVSIGNPGERLLTDATLSVSHRWMDFWGWVLY